MKKDAKQFVDEQLRSVRSIVESKLDVLIDERYYVDNVRTVVPSDENKADKKKTLESGIAELVAIRERLDRFINKK